MLFLKHTCHRISFDIESLNKSMIHLTISSFKTMIEIPPTAIDFIIRALGLLSAIILLVSRLDALHAFFDKLNISRSSRVLRAQNYSMLSDEMTKSLTHAVDKVTFYKLYKLNLNRPYREKILRVERLSKGAIDCDDFRRAGFYVNYENNEIYVLNKQWYKLKILYNNIAGFIYFAIGFILILASFCIFITDKVDIYTIQHTNLELILIFMVGIVYIFNSINAMKDRNKLKLTETLVKFSEENPSVIKVKYGKRYKILELTDPKNKKKNAIADNSKEDSQTL